MSITVSIIPTSDKVLTWGQLKEGWRPLMNQVQRISVGEKATLRHLATNDILDENASLTFDNAYYLELAVPNTLRISIRSNKRDMIAGEEQEYIEATDINHKMIKEKVVELAHLWQKVGYSFDITSAVGRDKNEAGLMITLAVAIAYLSMGYIAVNSNDFNSGPGIFSPDQFSEIQPKF